MELEAYWSYPSGTLDCISHNKPYCFFLFCIVKINHLRENIEQLCGKCKNVCSISSLIIPENVSSCLSTHLRFLNKILKKRNLSCWWHLQQFFFLASLVQIYWQTLMNVILDHISPLFSVALWVICVGIKTNTYKCCIWYDESI